MPMYRLRYQLVDAGDEHAIIMENRDIEFFETSDAYALLEAEEYYKKERYRVSNSQLEEIQSRKVSEFDEDI